MVEKIKVYITEDGKIFPVKGTILSDGYVTSDGKVFLDELEAYKYDNIYLENNKSDFIIDNKITEINKINGVDISGIKMFDVGVLSNTSCTCIPNTPLIYLWYNVFEKMPYIGSSKNPQYRASVFMNMEAVYAGSKINKARKRYAGVYGAAWKYFILEENINENELLDREKFYIDKFNSISNGYNTAIPSYYSDNSTEIKRKQHTVELFSSFCKRVEAWGMTVGNSITVDNYSELYGLTKSFGGEVDRRNPYSTRYPSFRLTCFMNGTTVVEYDNLKKLLHSVNQIIDWGKNGFKNDSEIIPSSMIRYRVTDNSYLSLDDNDTTFESAGEAIVHRVKNLKKKILECLDEIIDKDEYYFVSNASVETLIDLCYHDAEKIKKFLECSNNDKMIYGENKEKTICCKNQLTASKELVEKYTGLTINGSLVEFKSILTYYNLLPNTRYSSCGKNRNGVYLCYNVIENKPFVGATIDIVKRLPSFFFVGAFGGKKLDEVRKKYYDNKDAWVIFILEEDIAFTELSETLMHYIDVFDSINNGYNTRHNTNMVYTEESLQKRIIRKKITEEKNFVKGHYGLFEENISKFGMVLDKSFTIESYEKLIRFCEIFGEGRSFMKRDIDKYPSFRISCLLNNTNIVTDDMIRVLPYGIAKHTDFIKTWYMCDTEIGKIPSFMRYNIFTKEYTVYGLCGKRYPTLKEAFVEYCNKLIDNLHRVLNASVERLEIDKDIIEYIENINHQTLVRTCFQNPEQLINILES